MGIIFIGSGLKRPCGLTLGVWQNDLSKQNPEGPIIELPKSKHDLGNKKMHPFGNQKGKDVGNGSVRHDFGNWRREYWKYRARKELRRRGLKVGKSC